MRPVCGVLALRTPHGGVRWQASISCWFAPCTCLFCSLCVTAPGAVPSVSPAGEPHRPASPLGPASFWPITCCRALGSSRCEGANSASVCPHVRGEFPGADMKGTIPACIVKTWFAKRSGTWACEREEEQGSAATCVLGLCAFPDAERPASPTRCAVSPAGGLREEPEPAGPSADQCPGSVGECQLQARPRTPVPGPHPAELGASPLPLLSGPPLPPGTPCALSTRPSPECGAAPAVSVLEPVGAGFEWAADARG